ncbi:unnamed protein product [Trifolium pratense]|uniref:Uncharacterized protein n=1 Tax=Trifolium pratense TaxID=57577 RepID=A0ACB0JVT1_TRIPR|nr:unnamed protein product [Trifolium pratense]
MLDAKPIKHHSHPPNILLLLLGGWREDEMEIEEEESKRNMREINISQLVLNNQISLTPWWRINEKKNIVTFAFGNNVPVNVKNLFRFTFMNRWSNRFMISFKETTSFQDSDILISFVEVDGKYGVLGSWDCIIFG